VSGKPHTPAALPPGKKLPVPIQRYSIGIMNFHDFRYTAMKINSANFSLTVRSSDALSPIPSPGWRVGAYLDASHSIECGNCVAPFRY